MASPTLTAHSETERQFFGAYVNADPRAETPGVEITVTWLLGNEEAALAALEANVAVIKDQIEEARR